MNADRAPAGRDGGDPVTEAAPLAAAAEDAPAEVAREGDTLRLSGALTTMSAGHIWKEALRAAEGAREIDLSGLTAMDTSGAALVLRLSGEGDRALPVKGAGEGVAAVLERVRPAAEAPPPPPPPRRLGLISGLGAWGVGQARRGRDGVAFLGEGAVTVVNAARRPRDLRFNEVLRHLDEAGTRAFGLVILLGTLIGIILAFQSAIPLRAYGADIFVPRLTAISLLRELGPLLAGVILAGRTGSAFAAELGTMTVNEEISALRIMGVDPMVLLVLPRMVAATLVMPVLALLMNVSGLIGMTLIMLAQGYPLPLVFNQILAGVGLGDLAGGLAKAAFFGLAIAGIGCRAGLQAGSGPRAVGDAATAAVVGGIVGIVVLDGVFSVLYYRLGW